MWNRNLKPGVPFFYLLVHSLIWRGKKLNLLFSSLSRSHVHQGCRDGILTPNLFVPFKCGRRSKFYPWVLSLNRDTIEAVKRYKMRIRMSFIYVCLWSLLHLMYCTFGRNRSDTVESSALCHTDRWVFLSLMVYEASHRLKVKPIWQRSQW